MSFVKTSPTDILIQTETLAMASGASTTIYSSMFKGEWNKDFGVMANIGSTNLATSCKVNIVGSFDGVTYATTKDGLIADCDAAVKFANYDAAVNGSCPYYKVALVPTSNMSSESVQIAVGTERRS